MATFNRQIVLSRLITAWLLLTSACNVTSHIAPEAVGGDTYRVSAYSTDPDVDNVDSAVFQASRPKAHQLLKLRDDLEHKLQNGLEKDTSTEDSSESFANYRNGLYKFSRLGMAKMTSSSASTSGSASPMSKRDFRTSARMRTLLRVEAPCAGGSQHSTLGVVPTAASLNVSPRDLLGALGAEAIRAKRTAQHIIRKYEAMGMSAIAVGMLGNSPTFGLNIRDGSLLSSAIRSNTAALGDIYRHLARAALYLEAIVDDHHSSFTPLVENLKENGVYNLLCGVKIVMDYKDASFSRSQNAAAILSNTRIMAAPSSAQRLARNYIIITQVAELLGEVGARLTLLARF